MKEQVENILIVFEEMNDNKQSLLSLENYNKYDQKVNKFSFQMKQYIMNNQCFMVLWEDFQLESSDLWRNIFPIIHINGYFVDKRKHQFLK